MNAPIREQMYINGAMSKAWVRFFESVSSTSATDTISDTLTEVSGDVDDVESAVADIETTIDALTGCVAAFAMNSPPTGWLKCNGAAVSRTTYAALFAAIGTTFGSGNGSTTFNLPDLRGEFVRGWADNRAVDTGRAFGSTQGDVFKAHTHTARLRSSGSSTGSALAGNDNSLDTAHDFTTGSTGDATETRPRNVALLYCIKT